MNRYKNHQTLIKNFKIQAQKEIPGIRIFDHPVGLFYTKNGTPIKVGKNGQSDCFALININSQLVYISIEFKSGNATQSKDQKVWQNFIENIMGGIYLLVRDDYHKSIEELKIRIEQSHKKVLSLPTN